MKAHLSLPKTTPPPQPKPEPSNNPLWMQQPWLVPPSTHQQQCMMGQPGLWMMGQQFPGPWMQPQQAPAALQNEGPTLKPESEARAARRAHRKDIEEKMDARWAVGQKPHKVRVKAGGGIDWGCEGKNEFDKTLWSLVPRILDVSYVKWKDQSPCSIDKLRSALDNEFEYLENNLSEKGFKNAVKRHMKTERSKMKAWFLGGKKECPIYIELDQWTRHCEYWSKPKTKWKENKMANARKLVKNQSTIGQASKARKRNAVGMCCV